MKEENDEKLFDNMRKINNSVLESTQTLWISNLEE